MPLFFCAEVKCSQKSKLQNQRNRKIDRKINEKNQQQKPPADFDVK